MQTHVCGFTRLDAGGGHSLPWVSWDGTQKSAAAAGSVYSECTCVWMSAFVQSRRRAHGFPLHHSACFLQSPTEHGARLAASAASNVIESDSETGFLFFFFLVLSHLDTMNRLYPMSFMGVKNLTCNLPPPFWFPYIPQQLNTSQSWFGIYHPFGQR